MMTLSDFLPICDSIIEENGHPKVKMINEYLLIGKLGAGFFSKVYLALNLEEKENKNDPNKYYAAIQYSK